MAKLAYWVGVLAFLAGTYFLIVWFATSLIVTDEGAVRWAEGFERTAEHFLD